MPPEAIANKSRPPAPAINGVPSDWKPWPSSWQPISTAEPAPIIDRSLDIPPHLRRRPLSKNGEANGINYFLRRLAA
jgi:hypothetical protein